MESNATWQEFENESDTDFALPQNVEWAKQIIEKWQAVHSDNAIEIPLVVAGQPVAGQRVQRQSSDPSRPELTIASYQQANADDVEAAVACAKQDPDKWREMSFADRSAVLQKVAQTYRERRGI